MYRVKLISAFVCAFVLNCAVAGDIVVNTTITRVFVNGAPDSANNGITCVKVAAAVSANCPSGLVAIPANNSKLLAAALQAKATGSEVWFYYHDNHLSFHCPGQGYTPCSVISIGI